MQPVVLLTGQVAGALAAYCVQKKVQPRNADIRQVQQILLNAKCYLLPYADVKPDDIYWEAMQKAGATGILKGVGKSEGWSNKTYFYPDSLVIYETFKSAINNFIPCLTTTDTIITRSLQVKEAWDMLVILLHTIRIKKGIPHPWPPIIRNEQVKVWAEKFKQDYPGDSKPITRKQLAVFINSLAQNPFDETIGWNGKLINRSK